MSIIDEAMEQSARRYSDLRDHCNHLTDQNRLMIILLEHIRETIDGFVDVEDGDYGAPKPNWAMQLTTEIDTLIGKD